MFTLELLNFMNENIINPMMRLIPILFHLFEFILFICLLFSGLSSLFSASQLHHNNCHESQKTSISRANVHAMICVSFRDCVLKNSAFVMMGPFQRRERENAIQGLRMSFILVTMMWNVGNSRWFFSHSSCQYNHSTGNFSKFHSARHRRALLCVVHFTKSTQRVCQPFRWLRASCDKITKMWTRERRRREKMCQPRLIDQSDVSHERHT